MILSRKGVAKIKIDVSDEDDPGEYEFVDYLDYQYSPKIIRRYFDTFAETVHLVGSTTEYV